MRPGIVAPADSLRSAGSSCDSLCWPPAPLDMLAAAAAHPQLDVQAMDEDRSSTADSGHGPHEDAPSSPPTPTARSRSSSPFAADDEAQEEPSTPPCVRSSPLLCPGAPRSRPAALLQLPSAGLRLLRPPPLIVGDTAAAAAAAAGGDMCSSPARSSRTYFAAAAAAGGGDGVGSSTVLLPPPPFLAFPAHQQQDKWEQQAAGEDTTADACLVPLLATALQSTTLLSVSCRGPGPLPGHIVTPAFDWRCDSSDARVSEAAALSAAAAGLLGLEGNGAAWLLPNYQHQQQEEEACEQTLSSSCGGKHTAAAAQGWQGSCPHPQQQQQEEEIVGGGLAAAAAATASNNTISSRGVYSSLRLTLPTGAGGPTSVRRPLIDSLTRSGLDSLTGAATCLTPVAAAQAAAAAAATAAAAAAPATTLSSSSSGGKAAALEAAATAAPAAWLDLLEEKLSARDAAAAAAAGGGGFTRSPPHTAGGISHKRAHSPGTAANKRQHRLHQQQQQQQLVAGAGGPAAVDGACSMLHGHSSPLRAVMPGQQQALPPPGLVALRMLGYNPHQL